MGKKTDTAKKAVAPQAAAAPATTIAEPAKTPAKKAAPKKAPAKKGAAISADDIALRAYFISEKRQAQGLPGDAHQDWLEAERQLRAELESQAEQKKPVAKKAPAKSGTAL